MSKELAKAVRAKRTQPASAAPPPTPARRDAAPTHLDLAGAHAALGNAAVAAQTVARPPLRRTPADALGYQAGLGNGAVSRAARAGEFDPSRAAVAPPSAATAAPATPDALAAPPPAHIPSLAAGAPTQTPEAAPQTSALPGAFDTTAAPRLTPPLLSPFYTVPFGPAPYTGLFTPYYTPAPAAAEAPEEVSTIVFEQEEVVAGVGGEEKRGEEKAGEAEAGKEGADKAQAGEQAGREAKPVEAQPEEEKKPEEKKREVAEAVPSPAEAEAAKKEAEAEPTAEAQKKVAEEAGAGVVEPELKAAAGVEGAAGVAPAAAPAEGAAGDPELARWQAQVTQKTKAIKAEGPEGRGGEKRIHAAGAASVSRAGGARKKQQKEAEKIVEPPPPIPDPLLPPEQDPVPRATALVREASLRKLPNQTMPPLVKTPGDIMPEPPRPPSSEQATKATTAAEMELEAQEKAAKESGNKKEIERVKKARKAREKQLKLDWAAGKGEALIFVEEPAPPPVPMTKQTQADIGKVLAALSMMQQEGAKQIVFDARGAAYSGQVMQLGLFDPLGEKLLPEVNTYLGKKIEDIGAAAGFKKEDLERQVAARKEELAKRTEIVHGGLTDAASIEKEKVRDEHQKNVDQSAGVKNQAANHVGKLAAEITFRTDPAVIRQKRDQLVTAVAQKMGQQTAAYQQAGERRSRALGETLGAYIAAYAKAGQLEEAKYRKQAKKAGMDDAAARAEAERLSKPTFEWIYDKLRPELTTTVQELQRLATETAAGYVADLKTAASNAIELIGEWADELTGNVDTLWNGYKEETRDWEIVAKESAAAWEASQTLAARDALVQDIDSIRAVTEYEEAKAQKQKKEAAAKLDEQQAAVKDEALEAPPGQKDAILTVALRLKDRLSAEQRAGLVQKLEAEVDRLEDKDWRLVEAIARAESPGADALNIASEVYKAAKGVGTDEDRIYRALANMTPMLTRAVRMCYRAKGYGDIDERLDDELSGAEYDRAKALLEQDRATAGAAAIRYAVFPGAMGGNVSSVLTALKSAPPAELRAKFKKEYGYDLDAYLRQSLGSEDFARVQAVLTGNKTVAYAAELKHAVGDEDRKGVEAVYAQIRADVEAEAAQASADVRAGKAKTGEREWDTARIEAEVKKRAAEVEAVYNKEAGEGGFYASSLKEDIEKKFDGEEQQLALALYEGDRTAADAARLKMEDKAGFKQGLLGLKYVTGDQKTIIKVLEAQGERARAEAERDENIKLREKREAFARDQQIGYLRGWTPEEVEKRVGKWDEKKEREQLKKNIEAETKKRAAEYMNALESRYDEQAGAPGSLDAMLTRNVLGAKGEKAQYLLEQKGILTPEQTLHYAVADEDADAVKNFLAATPQEEMKTVELKWRESKEGKAWLAAHEGKGFEDFILSDFEGRDRNDIKVDIKGAPATPKEALARKKEKLDYEKTAYGWAAGRSPEEVKKLKETFPHFEESGTDIELRNMEEEYRQLEEQVARLDKLTPGTPQYQLEYEQYEFQTSHVEQSITNYRDAIDFETERVAMIAGIIATALVVVLTAGAATPLLIAAAAAGAAAAGAAATIIAKQLMKGSAYTRSEMMTDIVVGAVDALVSAATAGLGGKLLKAFGPLAKMAKSPQLAPRLLAHGLAEGAENFIATIPTSLAQQMMDKRSEGISLSAAISGAAFGAALGGLMGSVGGFKKPAIKATAAVADSADLLVARGTAAERHAAWQSFRKANPEKGYQDFLGELDAGLLARQADEEAVRQAQRQMRQELFTDIPPAQRGKFKDVPIEVVSDAEFERLTRSKQGQAVVLIEDGKPRVLMRESADPKVLREEGIHLLQSADPTKAHLFRDLDEKVLSKWDELPLDQQIGLYSKKLDLEIDGQQRLIKNLEGALEEAGDDPAMRRQILDQLEDAKHTLDNLSRRLDEVGDLTPQKRLDIDSGKAAKPDYLQQPARLFGKPPKKPKLAAISKAQSDLLDAIEQNAKTPAKAKKAKKAAEAALEDLRRQAGSTKALQNVYRTVADTANQLGPAEAQKYLKKVKALLDSRRGNLDRVADFLAASQKAGDPTDFLNKVVKLSDAGGKGARLTNQAMGDIAKKVSQLTPAKAGAYLDDVSDLLNNLPSKLNPSQMSNMLSASAKTGDPSKFISKLKNATDYMKANNLPIDDNVFVQMGEKAATLKTKQANEYLDAFNRLIRDPDVDIGKVNGFLRASKNSDNPGKYLDLVSELSARKKLGLTDETIEALAKKADDESLDLEWLMQTPLLSTKNKTTAAESMDILNFLAKDEKTPWKTLREAFDDPDNEWLIRWSRARLRGIAGEIVADTSAIPLLKAKGITKAKLTGRQVKMYNKLGDFSEIDFEVTVGTKIHGLEVKAHTKRTWEKAIDGWWLQHSKKAVPSDLKDALKKIESMLEQLKNAHAHTGNTPFLAVTEAVKSMSPARKKRLQYILSTLGTAAPEIIYMAEKDITTVSAKLRKRLGLE